MRAFLPESKGDASGYQWLNEIRFIPDTELMLLESNSSRGNDTKTTTTSCIQLIDEGGRTLWAASQHKIFGADKEWPFPKFRILGTERLAEEDPFADLKIYPNPTSGVFNIEMDNSIMGELLIDIFSGQGSKILSIKFLKKTSYFNAQVDLSGQAIGLYLIGLQIGDSKAEKKILLE